MGNGFCMTRFLGPLPRDPNVLKLALNISVTNSHDEVSKITKTALKRELKCL